MRLVKGASRFKRPRQLLKGLPDVSRVSSPRPPRWNFNRNAALDDQRNQIADCTEGQSRQAKFLQYIDECGFHLDLPGPPFPVGIALIEGTGEVRHERSHVESRWARYKRVCL
jgi:hypothetical protein